MNKHQKMRNTTQILLIMAQKEKEYTTKELFNSSNLTINQVKDTLMGLCKWNLVKRRKIRVNTRPYRNTLYFLNPKEYEYIIQLLRREVDI